MVFAEINALALALTDNVLIGWSCLTANLIDLPGPSVHHHERRFTVDRQNRRAAGVLKVRHEARGVAFELGQGADIFGDVHGVLIVNASNKMRT